MVVIDLEKDDDPQVIFETLNARGTPLLPADLVKNYLFHKAIHEKEKLELLYEDTWKPFDEKSDYWRALVGRGRAQRARLDLFLQHYLTVQIRDEVSLSHLYTQFCRYAEADGSAKTTLATVRRFADIYQWFDHTEPGSRAETFFRRLASLDIGTAYPFLLALYTDHMQNPRQVEAILNDLESFLVRRMVCQLNTRGYNTLFLSLLKALYDTGGNPDERVRNVLKSGDAESTRWPDDAEFKQAWTTIPAYRVFTAGRVRMLLEALEHQLRSDGSEKIEIKEKLTVEHLMPRSWQAHWPLTLDDNTDHPAARARRDEVLHTLGNLTLLTRKLNPAISNGPWTNKVKRIKADSALALNRNLIPYSDKWDESTIRKRNAQLFMEACRIWPFPRR